LFVNKHQSKPSNQEGTIQRDSQATIGTRNRTKSNTTKEKHNTEY